MVQTRRPLTAPPLRMPGSEQFSRPRLAFTPARPSLGAGFWAAEHHAESHDPMPPLWQQSSVGKLLFKRKRGGRTAPPAFASQRMRSGGGRCASQQIQLEMRLTELCHVLDGARYVNGAQVARLQTFWASIAALVSDTTMTQSLALIAELDLSLFESCSKETAGREPYCTQAAALQQMIVAARRQAEDLDGAVGELQRTHTALTLALESETLLAERASSRQEIAQQRTMHRAQILARTLEHGRRTADAVTLAGERLENALKRAKDLAQQKRKLMEEQQLAQDRNVGMLNRLVASGEPGMSVLLKSNLSLPELSLAMATPTKMEMHESVLQHIRQHLLHRVRLRVCKSRKNSSTISS